MTKGEGRFLFLASVVALGIAVGAVHVKTSGGQRQDQRGHGDDQYDEGLGLNATVELGFGQPSDETRWHYGGGMPGEALPTNWERHRLAYPRRQCGNTETCAVTPLNHPAFPRRDAIWYYQPPAERDL